jgi:dephospho-CoA kinase
MQAVLLTGTVGSGKTAVATEMGVLLEASGVPCVVVDLDWLGWVHLPEGSRTPDDLIARNLAAIWPNLLATGARHAVLTRGLLATERLDALRRAIPDADLTVVRLTAPPEVIEARLRRRDEGAVLEEHLEESGAMARAMEEAGIEDLIVENDRQPLREVAAEVLRRLGWPATGA